MITNVREILFRGKRVDNGEWVKGSPKIFNLTRCSIAIIIDTILTCVDIEASRGYCSITHVMPETVGQYTGLTDKNGQKIFEGDIVKTDDKNHDIFGVCKYNTDPDENTNIGFHVEWINDNSNLWNDWLRRDLGYWRDKIIVIGNIHDNPELIKEPDA